MEQRFEARAEYKIEEVSRNVVLDWRWDILLRLA